jgi:hypothetical protein
MNYKMIILPLFLMGTFVYSMKSIETCVEVDEIIKKTAERDNCKRRCNTATTPAEEMGYEILLARAEDDLAKAIESRKKLMVKSKL